MYAEHGFEAQRALMGITALLYQTITTIY